MTLVDKLYKRDIEEAYQRRAADARAKLLAEVCAWLRTPELATIMSRQPLTVADAIEAKFGATDISRDELYEALLALAAIRFGRPVTVADAIEAKFKATEQPKEKP